MTLLAKTITIAYRSREKRIMKRFVLASVSLILFAILLWDLFSPFLDCYLDGISVFLAGFTFVADM